MTQFTKKSFSVNMGSNDAYRDNWERTFGRAAPELEHAAEQALDAQSVSRPVSVANELRAKLDAANADRARLRGILEQVRTAMAASDQGPDGDNDPRRPLASAVWAALASTDASQWLRERERERERRVAERVREACGEYLRTWLKSEGELWGDVRYASAVGCVKDTPLDALLKEET